MSTTFRADVVAGMTTMMNAFIAAHPTVVRRHFRFRPPSTNTDLPCSYLDVRPESIAHANGIRTRTMSPSVVVVFRLTSNDETEDVVDAATDLLVDHFTDYPHIAAGTVWDAMTVSDEDDELGIAVRFTFGNLELIEGRT